LFFPDFPLDVFPFEDFLPEDFPPEEFATDFVLLKGSGGGVSGSELNDEDRLEGVGEGLGGRGGGEGS